jgi:hypothetical protein
MQIKKVATFFIILISPFFMSPAEAYDWVIITKVTMIEADYMPGSVVFQVSSAGGLCPTTGFISYSAQGSTDAEKVANINAVLATLMTAQSLNRSIQLYANNANCAATNIWLLNN